LVERAAVTGGPGGERPQRLRAALLPAQLPERDQGEGRPVGPPHLVLRQGGHRGGRRRGYGGRRGGLPGAGRREQGGERGDHSTADGHVASRCRGDRAARPLSLRAVGPGAPPWSWSSRRAAPARTRTPARSPAA